jgi:hypothetical protein
LIAWIVLQNIDLISQFDEFDAIIADIKKERQRFYFSLKETEQLTIQSHLRGQAGSNFGSELVCFSLVIFNLLLLNFSTFKRQEKMLMLIVKT